MAKGEVPDNLSESQAAQLMRSHGWTPPRGWETTQPEPTPATDEEVREWAERNALMIGSTDRRSVVGRERALIARIKADADRIAEAEARADHWRQDALDAEAWAQVQRDALRARLTLTDDERWLVEWAQIEAKEYPGKLITVDADRLGGLAAIIERLTGQAPDA